MSKRDDLPIHQKAMRLLRDLSPYVLWLVGILVIFFNLWISTKLNPLEQNIMVMAKQVDDIKQNMENIEEQHQTFVNKDTFSQLVDRINHISSRVDLIYSIVANKK